jgi:hypothetical protein
MTKLWAVVQNEPVVISLGPLVSTSLRTGREIELAPSQTMQTAPGIYRFATKRDAAAFAKARREAAGSDAVCSDPIRQSD